MAERCQHVDLENDTMCDCPHFVPKVNLTAAEVNVCDGCLHSIAWHQIPSQENTTSFTSTRSDTFTTSTGSTASSVDEILASFTSQATGVVGSAKKTHKRWKKLPSEAEARQEAVSGFKRSLGKGAAQDTVMVSPSTVYHIKKY